MLRIIYGKSGTGKSEYIYNEIKKEKDQKIYIITPEQFSFTAERKLMENEKSKINTEVLTFGRMAYRVANETGGVINTKLTKCGKAMLIYSILQEEKKNLKYLGKTDETINLAMQAITELKKHGISPEKIKEEQIEEKILKAKMEDIEKIYEKFEEKIKNKYIDETDQLTKLSEDIEKVEEFKNSEIYIDEFSGFTHQEYETIKKLLKIAKRVSITFCVDNLELNTNPNTDLFYPNKVTLSKILNLLEKEEKIEAINLDKTHRFKNEELQILQKNLNSKKQEKYEKEPENIEIYLAKNQYIETENIAKKIQKLVKEEKYRYKEIAIITKNIANYSSLIKSIFESYQIPVFIDEKRDLDQNEIVKYVLSILDIYIKNWSYEAVFNYIKSDFIEIDEEEKFKLEKYAIKYGIKQNKWKKEFTYGINETNRQEIERLEEIRKQIINPLIELKSKIDENKMAENICKELYLFLVEQQIERKINKKINNLKSRKLLDLAKEYETSYKIIINILDEINLIFKGEKQTIDKFNRLLKIGLKNSELGKIPSTQDQVIVGDVDRSRSHKVRAIFILGLNDGVFPSVNKDEGFLNDADRQNLKERGIELAKGTLENLYDDNFNIYKALTTAEEKLYLSYSSSDTEGKTLRASTYITKIKKMFPKIKEKTDNVDEIINEKQAYEELIININKIKNGEKINQKWYTIYKYYKESEKYKKILEENLKYINYTGLPEKIKKENIEKLYGNTLNTSVSRLERYKACPYSYFLQYALKLKEKEELKVQNLDTGSFMHEIIDEFFKKNIDIYKITEEEILTIVDEIIEETLKKAQNYIFTATNKYKLLVTRLKRIVVKALKYIIISLAQSEFNIEGTEIEFGEKGKYKPIILNLENGKKVEIIGKIDRIDLAQNEQGKFVRIIDYKSSVKNVDFNDVYAGLQLQLITYLDAVCKIEDFNPAGILYFNLLEQMIKTNKKLTEEEIEEKIKNNFKMKGIILADVKVAKMHDKNLNQGASKIVPAYIDKSGNLSPKKSSIATKEEFEALQKYINKTIKEIALEIYNGNIDLKPYYKNKKTPCEYCSYKNLCGIDSGICKNQYRFIDKLTKDEILEKMEKCSVPFSKKE